MSIALPLRAASLQATVVGADARRRSHAARLLAAAGFELISTVEPGTAIVLVAAEAEVERGREVRELVERHPDTGVLVVVPAGTPNASLRRTLVAGAAGIVFINELESALLPSVHAVQAGQLVVPSALARTIAPRPLSHREKQILSLVVEGLTNREIAERLYLAESTIKTHLSSVFRKIDARSRAEAASRVQDPDSGYGLAILTPADGAAAPT